MSCYERVNEFRINLTARKELGQGSQGTVYPGISLITKDPVAAKLTKGVYQKYYNKSEFEKEADLLLRRIPPHENIIKVYDFTKIEYEDKDIPVLDLWLITELCEFGNLKEFAFKKDLRIEQKIELMHQSALAVRHLHGCKPESVAHRDVKPENILLTGNEDNPTVKLCDFGSAKSVNRELGKTVAMWSLAGTRRYQAPEQVEGHHGHSKYDKQVDIFSLGITFLALLKARKGTLMSPETINEKGLGEIMWIKHKRKEVFTFSIHDSSDNALVSAVKDVIENMIMFEPSRRLNAAEVVEKLSILREEHPATQSTPVTHPQPELAKVHQSVPVPVPQSAPVTITQVAHVQVPKAVCATITQLSYVLDPQPTPATITQLTPVPVPQPAPSTVPESAPSTTVTQSAPVPDPLPAPATVSQSAPATVPGSAPSTVTLSAPVPDPQPAPATVSLSAPATVTQSVPLPVPQSAPATVPGSAPSTVTLSAPVPDPQPAPATVSRSAPATVTQSVPLPVTQLAPVPVPQSAPATVIQLAPVPVSQSAPATVSQSASATVPQSAFVPVSQSSPATVTQSAPATVSQSAPTTVPQSAPATVSQSALATVSQSASVPVSQSAPTTVLQSAPATVSQSALATVSQSAPATVSQSAPATVSQSAPATVIQLAPVPVPQSAPTTIPQPVPGTETLLPGTKVATLYSFNAMEKEDLCFERNDELTITESMPDPNWYIARDKSGQIGTIPLNYVRRSRSEVQLQPVQWLHGKMTWRQAHALLTGKDIPESITRMEMSEFSSEKDVGVFFVHAVDDEEDRCREHTYTLCVVGPDKAVEHYPISKKDMKVTIDEEEFFEDLQQLVQFYEKAANGLCTNLRGYLSVFVNPKDFLEEGWNICQSEIHILDNCYTGEFTDIHKGQYSGRDVFIRKRKGPHSVQDTMIEAAIMTGLSHKNLVQLIGVVIEDEVLIVTEFLSTGRLSDYLCSRGRQIITDKDLMSFARDVCHGMHYLEEKQIVHRKLAAKSVLLSEEGTAKVGDFSFARPVDRNEKASQLLVKWTAPEVLKGARFISKADVWSFGVLLWEIYSFGRRPYPGIHQKDILKHIANGYRMQSPEGCSDDIYQVMLGAWNVNAIDRPTFASVSSLLERLDVDIMYDYAKP